MALLQLYVRAKKITFKIDFMPNSNATQPIICLLVSSATMVSVM